MDVRASGLDMVLNLFYVLLALSVIVSLFGMVNTLILSVFERTRELGMLRAVGMTRRQVRRMVRQESVITALIGAAVGLPLGMFLAALVSNALADEGIGFQVPWGQLVAFTIVARDRRSARRDCPERRSSSTWARALARSALSMAVELPEVEVWATDVSADAIDVVRANLAGIGRNRRGPLGVGELVRRASDAPWPHRHRRRQPALRAAHRAAPARRRRLGARRRADPRRLAAPTMPPW